MTSTADRIKKQYPFQCRRPRGKPSPPVVHVKLAFSGHFGVIPEAETALWCFALESDLELFQRTYPEN